MIYVGSKQTHKGTHMNLNLYIISFTFEGGCWNCPLCELSSRRCRLINKTIGWRFKIDPKVPQPPEGERPVVKAVFNPYKHRDGECPMQCEKVKKKKPVKKKT